MDASTLDAAAAAFGRQLFDVPADNSCQFHALLHALNTQLNPPRASQHNANSLRALLVATLDDEHLLSRVWLAQGDNNHAPVTYVRDEIHAQTSRQGWSVAQWFVQMRETHEWGDTGTVCVSVIARDPHTRVSCVPTDWKTTSAQILNLNHFLAPKVETAEKRRTTIWCGVTLH